MIQRKEGFTLIELLVVIAIIGLLASILVPAVSSALTSAAMIQTVSNGKAIYESAFAGQMDEVSSGSSAYSSWPTDDTSDGGFANSTDYFIDLVTNGIMEVSFDFFAARDIPGAKSSKPEDFKEKNNAWKLVANVDGCKDGTPFLFTRNYNCDQIPTDSGEISENDLTDNNGKPFGTVGIVVVQKGGAAKKLVKKQRRKEEFNAAGEPPTGISLAVLKP
jgi:prepilin-type N-terminal cleavage/methylation domain-containing protein